MEVDIITFDDLRKIQKYERDNENPYKLDEEYLEKIKEYVKRKSKFNDRFRLREYENLLEILEEIFEIRAYKIMKMAFFSLKTKVNTENLLKEEKELFDKFRELLRNYKNSKFSFVQTEPIMRFQEEEVIERKEEETKESDRIENEKDIVDKKERYVKIKIKGNVPEFLGIDLKVYGPYKGNEVVEMPEKNAKILIDRGLAEKI